MRRPKIFYGWWIARSYSVMNFYWGGTLLIGFSVLFNPIKESFGLSATGATAIVSMRQGAAAVGSPFVGWAFDRVGPRPLMLAATILGAGGMSLVAFSHSTWQLVLSFLIVRSGYALARFMMAVPGSPHADATQGASALARFAALFDGYDASIRRMCLDLTRIVAGDLPQPALAVAEARPGPYPADVTPASPPQRPAPSTPEPRSLAGVTGRARL